MRQTLECFCGGGGTEYKKRLKENDKDIFKEFRDSLLQDSINQISNSYIVKMNNIVVGYTKYKKNPYIHTGIKIQMNK